MTNQAVGRSRTAAAPSTASSDRRRGNGRQRPPAASQRGESASSWDPLRDGYHPNDPKRRCFSCGAAPTGSYRDGSPSYGCGPHPPVEATREQLEAWGLA